MMYDVRDRASERGREKSDGQSECVYIEEKTDVQTGYPERDTGSERGTERESKRETETETETEAETGKNNTDGISGMGARARTETAPDGNTWHPCKLPTKVQWYTFRPSSQEARAPPCPRLPPQTSSLFLCGCEHTHS